MRVFKNLQSKAMSVPLGRPLLYENDFNDIESKFNPVFKKSFLILAFKSCGVSSSLN